MSSVYAVNKGINTPVTFRGLKAQYIGYLAGGLIALLVLFAILYVLGINTWVCLVLIFGLGTALFRAVFGMSKRYGTHGLLKVQAKRRLPVCIRFTSRRVFQNLFL